MPEKKRKRSGATGSSSSANKKLLCQAGFDFCIRSLRCYCRDGRNIDFYHVAVGNFRKTTTPKTTLYHQNSHENDVCLKSEATTTLSNIGFNDNAKIPGALKETVTMMNDLSIGGNNKHNIRKGRKESIFMQKHPLTIRRRSTVDSFFSSAPRNNHLQRLHSIHKQENHVPQEIDSSKPDATANCSIYNEEHRQHLRQQSHRNYLHTKQNQQEIYDVKQEPTNEPNNNVCCCRDENKKHLPTTSIAGRKSQAVLTKEESFQYLKNGFESQSRVGVTVSNNYKHTGTDTKLSPDVNLKTPLISTNFHAKHQIRNFIFNRTPKANTTVGEDTNGTVEPAEYHPCKTDHQEDRRGGATETPTDGQLKMPDKAMNDGWINNGVISSLNDDETVKKQPQHNSGGAKLKNGGSLHLHKNSSTYSTISRQSERQANKRARKFSHQVKNSTRAVHDGGVENVLGGKHFEAVRYCRRNAICEEDEIEREGLALILKYYITEKTIKSYIF